MSKLELTVLCPKYGKRYVLGDRDAICPACGGTHREEDFCLGMRISREAFRKKIRLHARLELTEKIATAIRYRKCGMSVSEIAKTMGQTEDRVRGWINEAEEEGRCGVPA